MKIDLKEFDVKDFLLRRGEWVGLAVAVLIALPAIFFGVSNALSSGSPTKNANTVNDLAKGVRDKISRSTPPPEADKPPPECKAVVDFTPADFEQYVTNTPWIVPSALEDTKRREPTILGPSQFQVEVRPVGFRVNILQRGTNGKLQVQVVTAKETYIPPKVKKRLERLQQLLGRGGLGMGGGMGGMRGGMPGMGMMGGAGMGGGMGMRGGMPGMGMAGGMPGMGGRGGMPGMAMQGGALPGMAGSRGMTETLELRDVDQLSDSQQQNFRLAETILPARMVVLTGSFPLKQQMEEFRQALRLRTLNDLIPLLGSEDAPWAFRGFVIERRTWSLEGKQRSDWEDISKQVTASLANILALQMENPVTEDEQLLRYDWIINPGLVMVRPELARGEYDKVDLRIPGIRKTLEDLAKVGQEKIQRQPSALQRRLQGEGIDVFNPLSPFGSGAEPANVPPTQPVPGTTEKKPGEAGSGDEPIVPEDALVRIIDTTVQAGNAYEYRLKLKMDNPNYKQKNVVYKSLADNREIVAEKWTPIPERAAVPYDTYWYATDTHYTREDIPVQIHHWIDTVATDPEHPETTQIPVADWTVLDRAAAYRGEYIGRKVAVKVPIWNTLKGYYELARNTRNRSNRLPVDFTVQRRGKDPALLIDYQGGRLQVKRNNQTVAEDQTPVQVLILTQEGRLAIHSTADDINNETRKKRFDDWKQWLQDVETGRARMRDQQKPNGPPGMPGMPGNNIFNKMKGGGGS